MRKKLLLTLEENYLKLYNQGLSDPKIGKILNIGRKTVNKYRKSLNLLPVTTRLQNNRDKIIDLFNQGKSDTEIAEMIGAQRSSVNNFRLKLETPQKNLKHLTFNEKILVKELVSYGFKTNEIAYYLHKDNKFISDYLNLPILEEIPIPTITEFSLKERAILTGILLGDGNIEVKEGKSPSFTTSHSPKQKEYCFHILRELQGLYPKLYLSIGKSIDSRTGKTYNSYIVRFPSSPLYNEWYNDFYVNRVKIIPEKCFNYFTAESLAYLYMDDGCKVATSYSIATMCFQTEELRKFQQMLLTKFNIESLIEGGNRLYIRTKSKKLFTELIEPYMPESMKYKLQK